MLQFFKSSFIFTAICLILARYVGGTQALFITCMLAILEISLSFDNAIINARELEKMNSTWKKRFLTRGMIIAVFGMRIFFPLVIVSIIGHVGLGEALRIALTDAQRYASIINDSHITLSAFGGVFLLMVFLSFFLDTAKDIHRINTLEKRLVKRGKLESIEVIIALLTLIGITHIPGFPQDQSNNFLVAGITGIITFLIVSSLSTLLQGSREEGTNKNTGLLRGGLGTFLYLEVLDASFSFDGVIGAFALTKNIIIIALGLGIGAMFVRSLTLMLVEKKTLSHYIYLEHGAFWAIGALALIMLLGSTYHIPELVTGLISGVIIALALFHSIYSHKKH